MARWTMTDLVHHEAEFSSVTSRHLTNGGRNWNSCPFERSIAVGW